MSRFQPGDRIAWWYGGDLMGVGTVEKFQAIGDKPGYTVAFDDRWNLVDCALFESEMRPVQRRIFGRDL